MSNDLISYELFSGDLGPVSSTKGDLRSPLVACSLAPPWRARGWLDIYLGVVKGHWKNSLKIAHVTNTYIGGMYSFTMNSHDPKGLMRL